MKTLVTGANGFLGKVLVKKLVADGHNVIAVTRAPLNKDYLVANVENIVADLSSKESVLEFPDDIENLIHLAQSSSYKDFPNSSQDIFGVNVFSGFQLLEYAARQG